MTESVLINGKPGDRIEVRDRGLHYGDGVFETMVVADGAVPHWHRHMARLRRGCQRLVLPEPDSARVNAEAQQLCATSARAVLKLIVTRGSGGRGYRPPQPAAPTRILSLHPFPEYPSENYTDGVVARWCATRLGNNPGLAGIKHLNRLEQVLARAEWEDDSCAEGLMLDQQGRVVCGTMSNLFWVHGGMLYTPPVDECGVAGITRERVIEVAQMLRIECRTRRLQAAELPDADEVFVCNSVIGVWPISRLAHAVWRRGPITARIMAALETQ